MLFTSDSVYELMYSSDNAPGGDDKSGVNAKKNENKPRRRGTVGGGEVEPPISIWTADSGWLPSSALENVVVERVGALVPTIPAR